MNQRITCHSRNVLSKLPLQAVLSINDKEVADMNRHQFTDGLIRLALFFLAGVALILVVLSASIQPALADDSGNTDIVINGCMEDVYNAFGPGGGLNCTANDVSLARATNIVILDDGCAFPGNTVTFIADFQVEVTSDASNDVGIYFALDGDPNGDGALTGMCTIGTPAYGPAPDWLDLDGKNDNTTATNNFGYCSTDGGSTIANPITPCDGTSSGTSDRQCVAVLGPGATCEEFGTGITTPIQDICGDTSKPDYNLLFPTVTLTVACADDDGDGRLDLPYCTSWRQTSTNELCLTPLAAYPEAPSICNCDPGFDIAIPVPGQIIVDKVTDPAGDPTLFDFWLTDVPTGTLLSAFSLTDATAPVCESWLDPRRLQRGGDLQYRLCDHRHLRRW